MNIKSSLSMLLFGLLSCGLTACGGGGSSNVISEKPQAQDVIADSCTETEANCFNFALEYPVAGLNYQCSSNTTNTYLTKVEGSAVVGACRGGDTIRFFVKGTNASSPSIELGEIKIKDLASIRANGVLPRISLLDLASSMTAQTVERLDLTDSTTVVAVNLARFFQTIGLKTQDSALGDVQIIRLTESLRNDLSKLSQSIQTADIVAGRLDVMARPWLDVSVVNTDIGFKVLNTLVHLSNGGLYQADVILPLSTTLGSYGYIGSGNGNDVLGSFYLLTDRQGYTQGYGMQWRGKPNTTSNDISSKLILITQVEPIKMHAAAQTTWLNPISRQLNAAAPYVFTTPQNDQATLYQGKLLQDRLMVGTANYLKAFTGETVTADDVRLGLWRQTGAAGTYTGTMDVNKLNPLGYLDKRVFKTAQNVASQEKYFFPLYATLTFSFDDGITPNTKLGIVIDEQGDIRTDIGPNPTITDMSGQCQTVDSQLKTATGQQQYRIGTLGAAVVGSDGTNDYAVTPRVILTGSQFGYLDGVMLGLNTKTAISQNQNVASLGGVRINLYELLKSGQPTPNSINLQGFNGTQIVKAAWGNIFNSYYQLFTNTNTSSVSSQDLARAKRVSGSATIQLAPCYQVRVKP